MDYRTGEPTSHGVHTGARIRGAVIASTLLAAAAVCVPGCNTVEGAGEDIEAAGEAISDAADDD